MIFCLQKPFYVQTGTQNVSSTTFVTAPPSPSLVSAQFTNTGGSIVLMFDKFTDQGVTKGKSAFFEDELL